MPEADAPRRGAAAAVAPRALEAMAGAAGRYGMLQPGSGPRAPDDHGPGEP